MESKATKRNGKYQSYSGTKEFTTIKDGKYYREGTKVSLSFEMFCIFKKLKLI